MKTIFLNAFLGLGFYLLVATIFYGYHPFMIASFLTIVALFGFFQNKNKTLKETKVNLLALVCPLFVLMAITGIFNNTFIAVIPYLIFTPLVLSLIYQAIRNKNKKVLFLASIIGIVALSLISFNHITGVEQTFEKFHILDIF